MNGQMIENATSAEPVLHAQNIDVLYGTYRAVRERYCRHTSQ